jgi:spermidine synthase
MSTLASYLLGNTVLQWTLIVSLMLFAMGVGSRISKYIRTNLLDVFVTIEFVLSLFCAFSATVTYFISAYTHNIGIIIYTFAFCIGFLIGLEIPLATRLNDYFEELRVNISSVMEKDYYGALLGGLLFAFIALPYLGLTYTPIILGSINFLVAAILYFKFKRLLRAKLLLNTGIFVVPLILTALFIFAEPIVLYGEQHKYMDRIIYREQSAHQRIVLTEWKDHYWLYLNGNEQFSSYDEERYHEPLVHPAMYSAASHQRVLILGGGDGLAAREVFKHPEVKSITLVDIDPVMTRLGKEYPILRELNNDSMRDPRMAIINTDAFNFLRDSGDIYDVIIIDLPDPKTRDLARLYSLPFYQLAFKHLAHGGILVTQATSPFFSRDAFLCIFRTLQSVNRPALAFHNHIPTLGEWAWILVSNVPGSSASHLEEALSAQSFEQIPTRFLTTEVMQAMMIFGKGMFDGVSDIQINTELTLALFDYYRHGNWALY